MRWNWEKKDKEGVGRESEGDRQTERYTKRHTEK